MTPMSGSSCARWPAGAAARAWPASRCWHSAATRSPTSRPRHRRRSPSTWRAGPARAAGSSARRCCRRTCGPAPATAPRCTRRPRIWSAGITCPVARATQLLAQLAGRCPTGWMAAVRSKAAALIGASGFPGHVRDLLRSAPALHADETPRTAGSLRYLHVAFTRYLTLMHTGDRSAAAITPAASCPATPASWSATGTGLHPPHQRTACLVRRAPAPRPGRTSTTPT